MALNRRHFLGASAAAMLGPGLVHGAEANERIKLGIIGTGNRGQWIGDLLHEHGGFKVTSLADYFQDRVDAAGEKLDVPPAHRYTGLEGFKAVLEDDVEAVAIMSPPYFHPEQAEAAVHAGKHAFVAKPVAVDVPGSRRVADSGRRATEKGLVCLVDYQTRADEYYREAMRRVHAGDLGELAFGESLYHANALPVRAEPEDSPENRLRNWVFDQALSGDIITEQNIHTLDVMSWIMQDRPPLAASGTGGRKVRTHVGDCWDYFTLVFEYDNGVGVTFSSRQFEGHGVPHSGIRNRMFGSEGVLSTRYGGEVNIRGEHFYRGGATSGIFRDGAVANVAEFARAIREADTANPTVEPSVTSNLVTILGRRAAYTGERVTWEQIERCSETLQPDLNGLA